MSGRSYVFIIFGLVVNFWPSPTSAAEFVLEPIYRSDTVYFRSTAKLEFIEGQTTAIDGYFSFDPESSTEVSGRFRVDLTKLRTGIATRDRHMRDRNLHTEKYPYAFFDFTSIEGLPKSVTADTNLSAMATGRFYIHGVSRPLSVPLKVGIDFDGSSVEALRIVAEFSVKLDDYDIPRPQALFLKLADRIEVRVILTGYNGLAAEPIILPTWPPGN